MGSCEIYPQKLEHSPNGRYVVACGDGEWIIYTSTALRNKCSSTIIFYVFKFFLYFQHLVLVKTSHGRLTPTPTPFKRVVRSSNSLRILRFSSHCHTLIMQNSPNQPKPSKNWVLIFKLHFRRVFFLSMRFFVDRKVVLRSLILQEVHSLRPDIAVEGLASGPLLAVRGTSALCFYGMFSSFTFIFGTR